MYSNKQILGAVVAHWAQPVIQSGAINKILPNILTSTGGFSVSNALVSAFAPIISCGASSLIESAVVQYLAIPDEAVPQFARDIIKGAIDHGGIDLWGMVLEPEDLKELLDLVELNMPVAAAAHYEVKTQ